VSAAKGRSLDVLAVEVDALHAWLCAAVAVIVADRQARGLPIPAALGGTEIGGTVSPISPRHLSLVVSR
jgi:hypothetical protein